ncbi:MULTISPECIES: Na+/H+ antiporter NhaA [Cryobacterium]|uniref:Na(+)/H(+) antiporter NhaA n=1 Tax=Cryobacterium zongtaii TaxID=1259217 RepID=A0A2S3ZA23_9MICO|nr:MULTISPECIES: Na+/H+ antiporter NhaA [Cryobacterium]ASD22670.1 sodium:proton antiporter [Cryobacterium sp. LW097]POH62423.1 sodium:proton antiporter [Cryobacterium zongtaii]POH66184.1 sodium:proton antiporter [Cryobacterium zongtaii]TFC46857.1 Na+/H+ antiporter NhaA [Cryobacterium sp. TMN-39-2]
MTFIRSERYAAGFLLLAGVLGLIMANLAFGPALIDAANEHLHTGLFGLDLSAKHWISDGLLSIFFFLIAIELKRELVIGDLNSFGKAALPALAALGGVAVPAGIYLLLTQGSGLAAGWPVPTATDIAFALGVLAVFGRGIPTRVRVFLLALAVLDDLVAILIIAFFFTQDPELQYIGFAAITATLFGVTSRLLKPRSPWVLGRKPVWPIIVLLIVLGVATWYFTYLSGVHATIAGVILGLVMARVPGGRTHHVLEPYSNAVILPLFAFSAALVAIPQVSLAELSPAFWGILVALPVGKLIGITLAGSLGSLISRRPNGSRSGLKFIDIVMVACLGGIGFTVSLLMGALAFAGSVEVVDEATLAVLLGSGFAILVSAVVVSARARQYRRAAETPRPAASPSTL